MPSNRTSLQDRIRQRQQSEFIGRDDQLTLFRRNFALPLDERIYIFNVFGQGGVGKSTLLRRFRETATGVNALTALMDDDQTDMLTAMDQLASELARQGHELRTFAERYRTYRQRRQELESEPDAPTGLSSLFARTLVKGGLSLARGIPIGGGLVDLVDSDAAASKAGEWVEYVSHKLRNNTDEIRLLREPVEELTRLWLADLNTIAEKFPVILFFDTYERTASFLDAWLRDVLSGAYGPLPDTTQLVVAGRDELDHNAWSEYESVIARLSLEPFTEQEAHDFLVRKGVTSEEVIKIILQLSGRLPLLVATLAAERPDDLAKVGDPSGTAVERFLIWTEDPVLRRAAVDAALPRHFNRDIISLLVDEKQVDTVFDWLLRMPFVEERDNGWAYHAVVREQMLRYKRRESQQSWAALHNRLAEYYERIAVELKLEGKYRWRNQVWRVAKCEVLYHRLSESPHMHLAAILNSFVECRDSANLDDTEQVIEPLAQVAEHIGDAAVNDWVAKLHRLIDADRINDEAVCVDGWYELLRSNYLTPGSRSIALAYTGISYRLLKDYKSALAVLTQAIDLAPGYTRAIVYRGVVLRELERYEEALVDLTQAYDMDPQYARALAERGITYLRIRCHEEAFNDFNHLIELNPQDSWALAARGVVHYTLKRYGESLADLTRAIEVSPQAAWWMVAQRGVTYHALKLYEDALVDFSRAIELDPQNGRTLAQRGTTYRELKRHEAALADLSCAIELNPQDARALAQRGETYRLLQHYEEALADFTRAIELDPKYAWAIGRRGQVYRRLQRYEEALADFTRAIELDPKYAWALTQRGLTYRDLGDYDKVIADLDASIKINNQNVQAVTERGRTHLVLAHYVEALTDFSQAIELDSTKARALAHRGSTYGILKRYDEALADLTCAIELDSQYAWALARRGALYRAINHYDEALIDISRAIELDKDNGWYPYQRALIHLLHDDSAAAVADFEHAIQSIHLKEIQSPDDWRYAFNLSLYLLASGETVASHQPYRDLAPAAPIASLHGAIQDLDDYLASFPDNADAQAIRAELQAEIDRRQAEASPTPM